MNQYKKLTVNTLLLFLGTMGSRLITFLMLPFYTNVLTPEEYGVINILLQTSNLLIPICTIGVTGGLIRFGLDKRYDKKDVFTTGVLCLGMGFTLCLLVGGIFWLATGSARGSETTVGLLSQYAGWILAFILASGLHAICGFFVRSQEKVLIFAITSIINTGTNVLLMVLFLTVFKWGIPGYLLAVITADTVSMLFLAYSSKLWRFIDFKNLHAPTSRRMLKYSVPIIPATICWWVVTVSDQFMLNYFIGSGATGIYSAAGKIPGIITILANVFIDAWQISIIGTQSKLEQQRFYSTIMRSYQAILYVMAGGLILFSKIVMRFMVGEDFFVAWQYIPFLVCATTFSCLGTFVGSVYTVEKKSVSLLVTTLIGAFCNIILNIILIPAMGINGAAVATFITFVLIFAIRMADCRKYIRIRWSPVRFFLSFLLLMVQSIVMVGSIGPVYPIQAVCLVLIGIINFKPLMAGVMKVLNRKKKKTA